MKSFRPAALAALFASAALLAGAPASAQEEDDSMQPYATNGKGSVARVGSREGPCIKTKVWTPETATRECHPELFAEADAAAAAAATAPTYQDTVLSASALFAFDSAVLSADGKAALQALGDSIRAQGSTVVDIDIIGHTDSVGPDSYNQGLSERRAAAVRDYLVAEKGIDGGIIDVSGMGETSPVADNGSAEGRAANRRVEVKVGVR